MYLKWEIYHDTLGFFGRVQIAKFHWIKSKSDQLRELMHGNIYTVYQVISSPKYPPKLWSHVIGDSKHPLDISKMGEIQYLAHQHAVLIHPQ